jgi:Uncharacterized conserved protein
VVYEIAAYVGPPPARASILRLLRYRVLDDSPRHSTPAPHADTNALADGQADITVRSITGRAECQACVALQSEIWGREDAVPASVLQVASHVGGIVAGAFAPDGELVGFVFGLPALIGGTIVHWSHALGVRDSARNAGVGRLLKEYQRTELARRGVDRMYWTYDPLVAKNAHLNLNLLGARVVEYVRDMYGTTASPLHNGLATDRLVVVGHHATFAAECAGRYQRARAMSGADARAAQGRPDRLDRRRSSPAYAAGRDTGRHSAPGRAGSRARGAMACGHPHPSRMGAAQWLWRNRAPS